MNDSTLRDDLLAIPGVEGAEVEGAADRPAGLRIRIAEGADQRAVGGAIRRVLTAHGLGTDTRLPGEPSPDGDGADGTGTDTTERGVVPRSGESSVEGAPSPDDAHAESEAAPGLTAVAVAGDPQMADAPEVGAPVIDLTDRAFAEVAPGADPVSADAPPVEDGHDVEDAGVSADAGAPAPEPPESFVERRLASVAVEEGRDGVLVRVSTSTGSIVEQHAASSEGGVESAVVRATAQLANPGAPEPSVVEIDDRRTEGVDIVTIVLDVDGKLHAGSAVVVAGRSFALGRATWAALSL